MAFRAPVPDDLDTLRRSDTSALPYLSAAITRFLQDYPCTGGGLSRTERRLLELAGDGIALWKAFPLMHRGEQAYYVTDLSLADLARTLAATSPALLTLDPADATEGRVLREVVTTTEAGRMALAGRLDRIAACGIDRWLGGVHLQNGHTLWRWDDTSQGIVPERS
jgi:hypothetical protein